MKKTILTTSLVIGCALMALKPAHSRPKRPPLRIAYLSYSPDLTNAAPSVPVENEASPAILKSVTYYFSATCYDVTGLESAYCPELSWTSSPGTNHVTLAWNLAPDPFVVGYNVYWGIASRTYNHMADCGFTNRYTIQLVPNNTNIVVTVCRGSNSFWRGPTISGPWTIFVKTNRITETNPQSSLFSRGLGMKTWRTNQ